MTIVIEANNALRDGSVAVPSRECPHCQTAAHMSPMAVPAFQTFQQFRPATTGIVYRCDHCGNPRFMKFAVRSISEECVELAGHGQEVEKGPEKFGFSYLPASVERLFREALTCYAADCHNAFASMCRRSALAAFDDLGEPGRLRMYEVLGEIRSICELKDDAFDQVSNIIFGGDGEGQDRLPEISAATSAILLESMKDILYQCYVRTEKLRKAMSMRRFFAEESSRKVTDINQRNRESA